MSFTTDIFSSITEDMKTRPLDDGKSFAMRLITYSNKLQTAFAINKNTNLKSIYLSVGDKIKSASFPKWHGVNIELAKLPDYGTNDIYVSMTELQNGTDYIFEIVAEDLRFTIEGVDNPQNALNALTAVLMKWKKFFQYDGEILLSPIRQQGLMGELYFLKEMIQETNEYAVAKWAGSDDETHDFYFDEHAVEVKTTSVKEPYQVHISSEYQLDRLDVSGELFLKFYALRKSQSSGLALPELVEEIPYHARK